MLSLIINWPAGGAVTPWCWMNISTVYLNFSHPVRRRVYSHLGTETEGAVWHLIMPGAHRMISISVASISNRWKIQDLVQSLGCDTNTTTKATFTNLCGNSFTTLIKKRVQSGCRHTHLHVTADCSCNTRLHFITIFCKILL